MYMYIYSFTYRFNPFIKYIFTIQSLSTYNHTRHESRKQTYIHPRRVKVENQLVFKFQTFVMGSDYYTLMLMSETHTQMRHLTNIMSIDIAYKNSYILTHTCHSYTRTMHINTEDPLKWHLNHSHILPP